MLNAQTSTLNAWAALLVLLAPPALAQEADYRSGAGDVYDLTPTGSGAVTLTSRDGVARSVGSASFGGPDVLLLRADCAAEADGETGTWGQGFLGFEVALPGRTVAFPIQRMTIEGARCPRP